MRSSVLAFAATLLAVTQARIAGFYAPQNVLPDADVKVEICTEGYIQSVEDVAFSFGLSTASGVYLGSLATLLSSKFLGPDLSNVDENITHYIHIPATFPRGPAVIQTAHFSLTGTSKSPATTVGLLSQHYDWRGQPASLRDEYFGSSSEQLETEGCYLVRIYRG